MGKGCVHNPSLRAVTGSGSRYVTETMEIRIREHRVLELVLETWGWRSSLLGGVKWAECGPEAVRGNLAHMKRTSLRSKPT